MTDKWAEHKQKFCGCKDASRLNRCQGRNNCELPEGHPERVIAAPRQPEGEGLEVVAYRYKVAYEFGGEVMCWEPNGRKVLETFPLADHADAQRAIAELREECEHLKDCQDNAMLHMTGLVSERDTLREECERLRVFNKSLDEEATKRLQDVIEAENEAHTLRQQRDRLAELLRMVRQDGWYHPLEDHEIAQIDAALAEVKPCPESPAPTT